MAVLNIDAATDTMVHQSPARTVSGAALDLAHDGAIRSKDTFYLLLFGPLPADVCEEEYTAAALFRGSLMLNYITGGQADMTFSARCYRAQRICRSMPLRLTWRLLRMSIDIACAQLRGESEHCATAWTNYLLRQSRKTF